MNQKTDVAIIGAGPAGLMAAEAAAAAGAGVVVFDRMPSPGRKFLMAGRGGLNLTHSEPLDTFLDHYGAARKYLAPFVEAFPPQALRDWAQGLGQETFIGSSGRVFPSTFKASPLLRAWLRRLGEQGVELRTRHSFQGWNAQGHLRFETPEGLVEVEAGSVVLALGGGSWPKLGSDGRWTEILGSAGVPVVPLKAANCGFEIAWSEPMRRFAGTPLKPARFAFGARSLRGECMITERGIEGGAIYALSAGLRDEIERSGSALLEIDLRPDVTEGELAGRLSRPRGGQSMASYLRKSGGLSPVAVALTREPGPLPSAPEELARRIKALELRLTGVAPLARAISSAGGVRFEGLEASLMLKQRPGVFVAGEMLDWEAPTGGYLLQACMATGRAAGQQATKYFKSRNMR